MANSAQVVLIPALQKYVNLDKRVDAGEGESIRARWDFGREMLTDGTAVKDLVEITGKSQGELYNRRQFAKQYPDEQAFSNTLETYGSWHELCRSGLGTRREMDVHYSSATDEWETPQDLFDELDAEFGFDLDVCALPNSAKCRRYYTPDDDGLAARLDRHLLDEPPLRRHHRRMGQQGAAVSQRVRRDRRLPHPRPHRHQLVVGQLPRRPDPIPPRTPPLRR